MLYDPVSVTSPDPAPVLAAAVAADISSAGRHAVWLMRMLDEIDYGMLLLDEAREVLHANLVARQELDSQHLLQLLGRQLRVRWAADLAPLNGALEEAGRRGLRRLVTLGRSDQRLNLAVVPLGCESGQGTLTLLVFGKRRLCPDLSAHWFARDHGLTPAEARVLAALCEGHTPGGIASTHGVALSTIRSQIGAIRAKTGAPSIRALVGQVGVLPPLVGVLRAQPVH
jgi:DNA-binding CsgD family transcriptional regulator